MPRNNGSLRLMQEAFRILHTDQRHRSWRVIAEELDLDIETVRRLANA